MDPISQAVLGAAAAGTLAKRNTIRAAVIVGALTGMAPDLDILIRSDANPLLMLQWHRHFTHALPLVPLFGLLCALILHPFAKKHLNFKQLLLFSTLGWGTHGLLDGCTTYGTWLWWPLSDARVNWDLHSIVDPLYTLPILVLVALAGWKHRPKLALAGLCWSFLFTGYSYWQHHRAADVQRKLAEHRGHYAYSMGRVMPTLGNSWVWRSVYLYDGEWYSDVFFQLPWKREADFAYIPGSHATALRDEDVANIPQNSTQWADYQFFRQFTDDYLMRYEPKDGGGMVIADARYGTPPPSMQPMWGIRPDHAHPDQHVQFWRGARTRDLTSGGLFRLMGGLDAIPLPYAKPPEINP